MGKTVPSYRMAVSGRSTGGKASEKLCQARRKKKL